MLDSMSQAKVRGAESGSVRWRNLVNVSITIKRVPVQAEYVVEQLAVYTMTPSPRYERSSLTVVPDAHGMVESLFRQLLLRILLYLLRNIGTWRAGVRDRQFGLLIFVHICKALRKTAGYCSPPVRGELSVLVSVRHLGSGCSID